jgi:glycosyltransferase involved in cell wall biosynthesis
MAKIICVATPLYAPDIGGPATHVALLEQGLSRDITLHIVKFSNARHLPKGIRHFIYFLRVLRTARRADVVYALDPVSVGFPALVAAWLAGKPFVLRIGGDYAWEQGVQRFGVTETLDEFVRRRHHFPVRLLQHVQSFVARHARYVIAPSEYLASVIRTWGVTNACIRVIYSQPEFSTALLSRSDARKKLRLHENEEIILSAGRLVPWKGFTGLVDALLEVRAERNAVLYIAGEGPGREELEAYIEKCDAQQYVKLLGSVPQERLATWLCASDMFALNTSYEGLSHTILEAFSARTPVITTPVGGNRELVENEVTGLLVPKDDTALLAASMVRLFKNRDLAMRLADNAYASLARFNKDIALEQVHELFVSL